MYASDDSADFIIKFIYDTDKNQNLIKALSLDQGNMYFTDTGSTEYLHCIPYKIITIWLNLENGYQCRIRFDAIKPYLRDDPVWFSAYPVWEVSRTQHSSVWDVGI